MSFQHAFPWVVKLKSQVVDVTVYWFAGLRVVSDFPLAGLQPCHDTTLVREEVVIRRAPVPPALASGATAFPRGQYDENELLLNKPKVARYLLRCGNEILIEPAPSADHRDVRAFLLGTGFAALCYQRGMLPLHSSVIDVADGCAAFVGPQGAGKSTLVAALAARGHQAIADDICSLQVDDYGVLRAWPGVCRVRLREDALAALGCNGPGIEQEKRRDNKYFVPIQPLRNPSESRRLRRVYQLHRARDGAGASITRLDGIAAIEVLMQNVYRAKLGGHMGFRPAVFAACVTAANDVPVFRFSRPMGFEAMGKGLEFLEDHLNTDC